MSLRDFITGDELYNPHIRIYDSKKKDYIHINSTTFGDEGQGNLIMPEIEVHDKNGRKGKKDNFTEFHDKIRKGEIYAVEAVVIELSPIGHKRPQISGKVMNQTIIGFLEKSIYESFLEKANSKI